MVVMFPPGEIVPLICEDCNGTSFGLGQESVDGRVVSFHTTCLTCKKRGYLSTEVETVVTKKFMQFRDVPENMGISDGSRVTQGVVTVGNILSSATTTTWPRVGARRRKGPLTEPQKRDKRRRK